MTEPRTPRKGRQPHPAQGTRIAAASLGTAATLGLVGAMALANDASGAASATAQEAMPPAAAAEVSQALSPVVITAPPVRLQAQPNTRLVPAPGNGTGSGRASNRPTRVAPAPDTRTRGSG